VEAEFSRPRLRRESVVTVVGGFVLERGDVSDGPVKACLVEPGDPVQGGELKVVDPASAFVVLATGLVEPDQALGLGIVVASPTVPMLASAPASSRRSL